MLESQQLSEPAVERTLEWSVLARDFVQRILE
jgi:hypothetical protein